jgi:hypothetical protein
MTCSLSQPRPHACQADSDCDRAPRFQARLEAADGTERVQRDAEACAAHLCDMVQALTAWARAVHLTEGKLTVLAVDMPLDDPWAQARPAPGGPEALSLAFAAIRLTG